MLSGLSQTIHLLVNGFLTCWRCDADACAGQVECLWDEVLPVEIRELPDDLARLDRVLSDRLLLFAIAQAWEQGARERGRPSISIATFVRLMVIKQRTGWGYETLVREVSDSLHLRRFCLIGIDQRVPDESTVRKLARRLGADVVAEITRMVIEKAQRDALPGASGADRLDRGRGRYPLSVRRDARPAGIKDARARGAQAVEIDRRREAPGSRSLAVDRQDGPGDLQDTGQADRGSQGAGDELNQQAGQLIARSAREAKRLAAAARASARGRGAQVEMRRPRSWRSSPTVVEVASRSIVVSAG